MASSGDHGSRMEQRPTVDEEIMTTTFNFDEWLDAAEPCDAPNVAGLVEAVEQECDFSGFKAERAANGKLIVWGCTGFCVNGFSIKPAAPGLQTGWRSGLAQLSSPVSASSISC